MNTTSEERKDNLEEATFGAGCFWGVEEAFRTTEGVVETEVGFAGGEADASYKEVCSGKTGHAEVVHLWFDPKEVSYKELLEKFFSLHDPTQVDRQGPDIGSQYRSVIFYHSEDQRKLAEEAKGALAEAKTYGNKEIATAIEEDKNFCRAEEYHQKYVLKNGPGSCHI